MLPMIDRPSVSLAVLLSVLACNSQAETQTYVNTPKQATALDEITVTATRSARGSKTVPVAVASVGKEKLEKLKMNTISDALQNIPGVFTYSKNGLSDSKLVIRGAGLKASYGIREIMVLRDGIPMTEPDSFTRLDLIDGQDIERLEVTKGPGNLYASGSAGGTVHIITKSVFAKDQQNRVKVGLGEDDALNGHLHVGGNINDKQAMSINATHREVPNKWRIRNDMSSNHVSVKHGLKLAEGNTLESELSYAKVDMQLAGSMDEAMWQDFKRTGKQTDVSGTFKHTGRYSENLAFNTRAEIDKGNFTFKPKVYYSQYHHLHPVTGIINDNSKNPPNMLGTDLAVENKHQIAGKEGKTVFGVAARVNTTKDAEKYEYADVKTIPGGRITSTLSDRKGKLAEISSSKGKLFGVFGSENIKLTDKLALDISGRVDDVKLTSDINQFTKYDYAQGKYVTGEGVSHNQHNMTLGSASLGASYALTPKVNVFANVAQADQIPADSELDANPHLKKASNRNVELGLKGRSGKWSFDTSVYDIKGKDEVVRLRQADGQSQYVNAGGTAKKGFELSGSYTVTDRLNVGGGYGYNRYKYTSFQELINGRNVERSGNALPFIPKTQTSIFADYKHPNGVSARVQARKDGAYYMDNANSAQWQNKDVITDLNVGYGKGKHKVDLMVDNVFDKRYAVEVSKDTTGKTTYSAGAPRAVLVNYSYQF